MAKARKPKAGKPELVRCGRWDHVPTPKEAAEIIRARLELHDDEWREWEVERELGHLWPVIPESIRAHFGVFPMSRVTWDQVANMLRNYDAGDEKSPREPIGFKPAPPQVPQQVSELNLAHAILTVLAESPSRLTREALAADRRVTSVRRDPQSIRDAINELMEARYVEEPGGKGTGLGITPDGRAYLLRFASAESR